VTINVAVLIACHNRRELTVKAILNLEKYKPADWQLRYYIFDDGSTDGTGVKLQENFSNMTYILGDGNNFWAKSMNSAMIAAMTDSINEAYLLMNDDVILNNKEALMELNNNFLAGRENSIIVGQVYDSISGEISYGGLKRIGRHPFKTRLLIANQNVMYADTFHGNFVLIPRKIALSIGPIDGSYAHAYADFDYGYRAREQGFQIEVSPGYVGYCDFNNTLDIQNSFLYLKRLLSKKGRPIKSHLKFSKRFGGVEWPIYFVWGYVNSIFYAIRMLKK
jgi:GT2 family glycosyltransferase